MTTYQLDQCLNDRKFAERCEEEAQGRYKTFRFPKRLVDVLDPEVLAALLPKGNPIITVDRALPEEHTECICEPFPGIVVVCHSPEEVRTMTSSRAERILENVKRAVPTWHELPLRNSVVFASEANVQVCRVDGGILVRGRLLPYSEPTWSAGLIAELEANAARSALPRPPSPTA